MVGTDATFTTAPCAPTLTSISPTSVAMGGGPVTLTVTGTNYVGTSSVWVDGTSRSTTYVSATLLTAVLPASDFAASGTHTITVVTPAPGGGTSTAATLTVTAPPAPTITAISPTSVATGSGPVTLTVTGTNYGAGPSGVWVDGTPRSTTYSSATQLTAVLPGSDFAASGTHTITRPRPRRRAAERRRRRR